MRGCLRMKGRLIIREARLSPPFVASLSNNEWRTCGINQLDNLPFDKLRANGLNRRFIRLQACRSITPGHREQRGLGSPASWYAFRSACLV